MIIFAIMKLVLKRGLLYLLKRRNAMKKATKKKAVTAKVPTCPKCGYEACICAQTEKAKIKKSRHELR